MENYYIGVVDCNWGSITYYRDINLDEFNEDEVDIFISHGVDIDDSLLLDSEPNYGQLAMIDKVSGHCKIIPITQMQFDNIERDIESILYSFGFKNTSAIWMVTSGQIEWNVQY